MIFHSLTFARSQGGVEKQGLHSPWDLAIVNDKIIFFDPYYCINSTQKK